MDDVAIVMIGLMSSVQRAKTLSDNFIQSVFHLTRTWVWWVRRSCWSGAGIFQEACLQSRREPRRLQVRQ